MAKRAAPKKPPEPPTQSPLKTVTTEVLLAALIESSMQCALASILLASSSYEGDRHAVEHLKDQRLLSMAGLQTEILRRTENRRRSQARRVAPIPITTGSTTNDAKGRTTQRSTDQLDATGALDRVIQSEEFSLALKAGNVRGDDPGQTDALREVGTGVTGDGTGTIA